MSIQEIAKKEYWRCQILADKRWGIRIFPELKFDLKGVSSYGKAFGSRLIQLNMAVAEIAERHGDLEEFRQTVGHEFAHCIASYAKHNNAALARQFDKKYWGSHGRLWKYVMVELGLVPSRTSTHKEEVHKQVADLQGIAMYCYGCNSCQRKYNFTKRRHNNVTLRGTWYSCHCGGRLALKK